MKSMIIDAHVHIFPDKVAERAVESIGKYYSKTMEAKGTIQDLLERGQRAGIGRYVIHSTATRVEQVEAINSYIADVCKTREFFIGFGTLHPGLKDLDAEMDRIISMGLKGIKLHPDFQDFNIDDEAMLPVYRAIDGRLPVLIHMGDENRDSSSPARLARIIRLFPGMMVIAAHLGGYRMWDDSMRLLVGKNIYMDTCSSLPFLEKERAVEIIRRHGVEKILFGTDYPMWDQEEELNRFYSLGLTPEERELILHGNAERLFGL